MNNLPKVVSFPESGMAGNRTHDLSCREPTP